MAPELAVEGVLLIESVTDWDEVLKSANDQDDAFRIFQKLIGDRWDHFIPFEWTFDGLNALIRKVTAGEAAREMAMSHLASRDV